MYPTNRKTHAILWLLAWSLLAIVGTPGAADAAQTGPSQSASHCGTAAFVATGSPTYELSQLRSLRSGPGLECARLALLPAASQVTVGSAEVEASGFVWAPVRTGAGLGWMAVRYTNGAGSVLRPVSTTCSTPASTGTGVTTDSQLAVSRYLRTAPGQQCGSIIRTLSAGTVVAVGATEVSLDGFVWSPVTTASGSGWIAVRRTDGTSSALRSVALTVDFARDPFECTGTAGLARLAGTISGFRVGESVTLSWEDQVRTKQASDGTIEFRWECTASRARTIRMTARGQSSNRAVTFNFVTVAPTAVVAPTAPSGTIVTAAYDGCSISVDVSIQYQTTELLKAADRDGIRLCGWGWRSNARQIELRRQHCGTSSYAIYQMPSSQCSPPTARPGTSLHEVGLAIDFYRRASNNAALSLRQYHSEFVWLEENASRFGLKNLPSEPWHWSTTGR